MRTILSLLETTTQEKRENREARPRSHDDHSHKMLAENVLTQVYTRKTKRNSELYHTTAVMHILLVLLAMPAFFSVISAPFPASLPVRFRSPSAISGQPSGELLLFPVAYSVD
jgi:hypothetical protein